MQAREARVVLVTTPDETVARTLARALVEERLAACGNIVPAITSIFSWQGAVQQEAEALLVLKTSAERVEALRARVVELHPYDVPEVLSLAVDAGNQPYLDWLGGCLTAGRRDET
jgi:periplasmic divalent cation tolerance protein